MVNYLARLGWSHGDQEIFTRRELIERFDIKDVASSGAIFDQTKLEWLDRSTSRPSTARGWRELRALHRARRAARRRHATPRSAMLETLRERAKTLRELVEVGRFYFERRASTRRRRRRSSSRPRARAARPADRSAWGARDVHAPALEARIASSGEPELKLVDLAQLTRWPSRDGPRRRRSSTCWRSSVATRRSCRPQRGRRRCPRHGTAVRLLLARTAIGVERRTPFPGPHRHRAVRAWTRPGEALGRRCAATVARRRT
jgi:hypothetical protein